MLRRCRTSAADTAGDAAAAFPGPTAADGVGRHGRQAVTTGPLADDGDAYFGIFLISYSAESTEDGGGLALAETDCYDDELQIGIFAAGDGATPELTSAWLQAVLVDAIDHVDGVDPDEFPPTATGVES